MTVEATRVSWTPPAREEVEYPDSNGMGMPDGDPQREVMFQVVKVLDERYGDDSNVYVTGDIFVYYVEGDPSAVFSPDVMVVKGVPKRQRDNYKLWEEGGQVPDFVMEIAARNTYKNDQGRKKGLYRLLGIPEYVMFDHTGGEYFEPPLQGYRLIEDEYHPIGDGRHLRSEVLGVEFRLEEGELRLYDAETGEYLPPPDEARRLAEVRAAEAEARASEEAEARRAAEARAAEMEAELQRLRAQSGQESE
ncbi:MAG: hypothetical protein MAG451_01756 [Anaerolineales bacterium]|nr:hypothetical protein [Anaerolineales bacterium]